MEWHGMAWDEVLGFTLLAWNLYRIFYEEDIIVIVNILEVLSLFD